MRKSMTLILLAALITGCSNSESDWDAPVIPVSLRDIETVNIDNSGEIPVITDSPIKKEAYMVGIRWITDNVPDDDLDKFITDPIQKGEHLYSMLSAGYSKAIRCNTRFNSDIPAGKYVSKFFKEINRNYLPKDVNEGFVLLVAPDPGEHSFRVEYYDGEELVFSHDTDLINFY